MDSKQINRDFLIRYYPNSNDRHYSELIGYSKLRKLFNRKKRFESVMKLVAKSKNDHIAIKLRRGCTIMFIGR